MKNTEKTSDKDIIKALECCSKSSKTGDCIDNKCPMLGEFGCYGFADNKLVKSALDLIKRQKAEKKALINGQETLQKYIAKQKAEIERLQNTINSFVDGLFNTISQAAKEMKGGGDNE